MPKYVIERDLPGAGQLGPERLREISERSNSVLKGRVVLLGFSPQHRAQPHGTFKLLFNSIHAAGMSP